MQNQENNKTYYKKKRKLQEGQGFYIAATVLFVIAVVVTVICDVFQITFPLAAPCMMNVKFHLYCPGCGGTRAMFALMKGQVVESFLCNPFVLYGVGLFLYYYIGTSLAVLCKGKKIFFRPGWWMVILGVIILLWITVIRNLFAVYLGIDYLGDVAPYWM